LAGKIDGKLKKKLHICRYVNSGKSESTVISKVSAQNTLAPLSKPQSINQSLGALFASGIPRKPSDLKQKAISGLAANSKSEEKPSLQLSATDTGCSSLTSIKSAPSLPQPSLIDPKNRFV
jgi:hypothetical protein